MARIRAMDSVVSGVVGKGGLPFGFAKLGPFAQEGPKLWNPFTDDAPLQRYLQRLIPQPVMDPLKMQ